MDFGYLCMYLFQGYIILKMINNELGLKINAYLFV